MNVFCGVVGFYAIVNLVLEEVKAVLIEVQRVQARRPLFV